MKYKTVVIDLPWPVPVLSERVGKLMHTKLSDGLPYKTMTKEEIITFPIDDFADDTCSIFMWTTQSMLDFSRQVLRKWQFKYSLLMTWDKGRGINHLGFFRNSEFILVGYRGKWSIRMDKKNIPTVIRALRTSHSEKPDLFYKHVERCTPEPRIDIFARKRRHGFDAYGDQVDTGHQGLEGYF